MKENENTNENVERNPNSEDLAKEFFDRIDGILSGWRKITPHQSNKTQEEV